mmetsp:Transcript_20832/g.39110  ORF Transcript_20832/g.39110 Transcript_20832/m.39110 type:complete len:86 (+) Transcript_20832:108-365(+)
MYFISLASSTGAINDPKETGEQSHGLRNCHSILPPALKILLGPSHELIGGEVEITESGKGQNPDDVDSDSNRSENASTEVLDSLE